MTSLFSRLQKLNKEATPAPWTAGAVDDEDTWELRSDAKPTAVIGYGERCFLPAEEFANGGLIVECRNSLPAVLNLIEAVVSKCVFCQQGAPRIGLGTAWHHVEVTGETGEAEWMQLSCPLTDVEAEAVAVFVSGQEEPR